MGTRIGFLGWYRPGMWTYETPYVAITDIRDHLAFYPDPVDAIEISGDVVRADSGSKF